MITAASLKIELELTDIYLNVKDILLCWPPLRAEMQVTEHCSGFTTCPYFLNA